MDINTINEYIDELENSDSSLSNVRNLSALYIVKSHLLGSDNFDNTAKELNDILPSYKNYVDVKRKYQLHETTEQALQIAMESLCKEIKEFLLLLFSSADTQVEKEFLHIIIAELRETF